MEMEAIPQGTRTGRSGTGAVRVANGTDSVAGSAPRRSPPSAAAVASETPGVPYTEQAKHDLQDRVQEQVARFESLNQSLSFRVHEGSGQLMVQILDRNTGDVLRETPPKEFLDLAVRLREMVGFFLDEKR